MYVGIDWASQRHAVCVVDDAGRKATAFAITHTADGFDQLVARLRAAPAGLRGTVEVEARRDAVLAMVKVLRALLAAIKDLDRSVLAHLGEHPDAEIFTSLPRSGRINAAQVLAEWGDRRPA
jgi:transposase